MACRQVHPREHSLSKSLNGHHSESQSYYLSELTSTLRDEIGLPDRQTYRQRAGLTNKPAVTVFLQHSGKIGQQAVVSGARNDWAGFPRYLGRCPKGGETGEKEFIKGTQGVDDKLIQLLPSRFVDIPVGSKQTTY